MKRYRLDVNAEERALLLESLIGTQQQNDVQRDAARDRGDAARLAAREQEADAIEALLERLQEMT